MANFTININKYIQPFYDIVKSIVKESCSVSTDTYSIGFQKANTLPSSTIFLLDNYTGGTKKFLHIKNVDYYLDNVLTPSSDFTIKNSGINLEPVIGITSINIEGLVNGAVISSLVLTSNITTSEVNVQKIIFEYAIEDTLGNVTEYITTTIKLSVIKCSTLTSPLISNYCTDGIILYGENITQHYLTVTLPVGENLSLRVHTTSKGIGRAFTIIQRGNDARCSGGLPYEVLTTIQSKEVGVYTNFIYNPIQPTYLYITEPWNVLHLRIWLFTYPLTGSEASLTNTHMVDVDILDNLDNIIYTVTLNESNLGV